MHPTKTEVKKDVVSRYREAIVSFAIVQPELKSVTSVTKRLHSIINLLIQHFFFSNIRTMQSGSTQYSSVTFAPRSIRTNKTILFEDNTQSQVVSIALISHFCFLYF